MIGSLRGVLVAKNPPQLMLDVQGVGYEIEAPMATFYRLPALGEIVTLFTHLVVREDAHQLFGFASAEERGVFRRLIKISGVGPKLALTLLSGLDPRELWDCVERNDSARLVRLPGVGKKTAERLIIELRDGLSHFAPASETNGLECPVLVEPAHTARLEAESALIALGYKPQDAARMVKQTDAALETCEAIIRAALQSTLR